jgi:hypothetical protein
MIAPKPLDPEARAMRHDLAIARVSEFEERCGHQTALLRLLAFMIEYLVPLKNGLPQEVRAAFEIAEQFREDLHTNDQIQRARDSCWQYLSTAGVTYDFKNRENCAVRAVLSALHREPPRLDLGEACYWFLSFADEVEDHSVSIDDLLSKHFSG